MCLFATVLPQADDTVIYASDNGLILFPGEERGLTVELAGDPEGMIYIDWLNRARKLL